MASQEFLASFAVDIDEAGVSRLQKAPDRTYDRTATNVTYNLARDDDHGAVAVQISDLGNGYAVTGVFMTAASGR